MNDLGKLVRKRRRQLNWSQKEMSERFILPATGEPCSTSYLSHIERGTSKPDDDDLLYALAQVLRLDYRVVFYAAGKLIPDVRGDGVGESAIVKAYLAFEGALIEGDA